MWVWAVVSTGALRTGHPPHRYKLRSNSPGPRDLLYGPFPGQTPMKLCGSAVAAPLDLPRSTVRFSPASAFFARGRLRDRRRTCRAPPGFSRGTGRPPPGFPHGTCWPPPGSPRDWSAGARIPPRDWGRAAPGPPPPTAEMGTKGFGKRRNTHLPLRPQETFIGHSGKCCLHLPGKFAGARCRLTFPHP